MRSLVIVMVVAGVAQAEPTKYPPPAMRAASNPTAQSGKAAVKGRVASKDGQPIAYFGLMIQKHGAPSYMSFPIAVRDAKGVFHFEAVEAGTWKLVLVGPGFLSTSSAELTLVDGKTTDAGTITVETGNELTGIVTDNRAPVAGARVCAAQRIGGVTMGGMRIGGKPMGEQDLLDSRDGKQCALSDKRGRYTIRGIRDAIPPRFSKATPKLSVTADLGTKSGNDAIEFARAMTLDIPIR